MCPRQLYKDFSIHTTDYGPYSSIQLNTNLTSVDSEQDASRKSLPSITNICKNINGGDLNDPSNWAQKQKNNIPLNRKLKLTGTDSRRTSTPNLGHLLPAVSPNISGSSPKMNLGSLTNSRLFDVKQKRILGHIVICRLSNYIQKISHSLYRHTFLSVAMQQLVISLWYYIILFFCFCAQ